MSYLYFLILLVADLERLKFNYLFILVCSFLCKSFALWKLFWRRRKCESRAFSSLVHAVQIHKLFSFFSSSSCTLPPLLALDVLVLFDFRTARLLWYSLGFFLAVLDCLEDFKRYAIPPFPIGRLLIS